MLRAEEITATSWPRLQAQAIDELADHAGFIAMPTTGQIPTAVVRGLVDLGRAFPRAHLSFQTSSLLSASRNQFVQNFLSHDSPWFLAIDSDQVFDAWQAHRLVRRVIEGTPICGALTPCHSPPWKPSALLRAQNGHPEGCVVKWEPESLIAVDVAGLTLMAIDRKVLEAIEPPWFQDRLNPNPELSCGEDGFFFAQAHEVATAAPSTPECRSAISCKRYSEGS